jgi:hypothetical protein
MEETRGKGAIMFRTIEAVIDEHGIVRLLEPIQLPNSSRALVTILDQDIEPRRDETARLSEAALSDWNRPEEDEAWAYLQQAP